MSHVAPDRTCVCNRGGHNRTQTICVTSEGNAAVKIGIIEGSIREGRTAATVTD